MLKNEDALERLLHGFGPIMLCADELGDFRPVLSRIPGGS
ncbi:hypothetical protein SFOMI_5308 [Sphingobium fuliginis]|uniref:Uncharacterized protein n=1 Tax=Sphingobium fuliginis (strain ATCC 27551) TaxID=336203 RepID=A0A292ZP93_SPHSA|nr:hypothetical protein SFOMI_5308 [Sphingobium fuliginis]